VSIAASDLLAFAQTLSVDANLQEAGRRTVVSRALYAAFHDTERWHRQLPAPGSLGNSTVNGMHAQLCLRLQTPDMTLSQELKRKSRQRGYALRAFHDSRTKADYHLTEDVTSAEVLQAIADAQTIISLN
jgi:hypothetical protein